MVSQEYQMFYREMMRCIQEMRDKKMSIKELRGSFENLLEPFSCDDGVDFEKADYGSVPGLVCTPVSSKTEKAILFFHGGAYTIGSSYSHRGLMSMLAKNTGFPVFGVDYRLAPECPFPAAIEDAYLAYTYFIQSYRPEDIILMGTSAGGGLALALMLYAKQKNTPLPKGCICICPWVDLALTGSTLLSNEGKDIINLTRIKEAVSLYCQSNDPKDPLISPIYGDLSDLPPLLIQVGEYELLFDEIKRLADKAKHQGVNVTLEIWPEMFHTWQMFAEHIPEGKVAIEHVGDWICKVFDESDT